jgi:hypothetical protein
VKLLLFLLLGSFLLCVANAQIEPVPIANEPVHHLVFQNEYTRVFYVEVPVGKQTLLHEHKNDYVFVTIGDSDVENMPQGKEPVHLELKHGDVRFVNAPLIHVAKNLANTPFKNVTIEILKKSEAGPSVALPRYCLHTSSGGSGKSTESIGQCVSVPVDNRKIVATKVDLNSSEAINNLGWEIPHLVVAIADIDLLLRSLKMNDERIHMKAGEVHWIAPEEVTAIQNRSDRRIAVVVVGYR